MLKALYYFILLFNTNGLNPLNNYNFQSLDNLKIYYKNFFKNKKYVEKIKSINKLENLDYTEILDKYNNLDTLFYIDPPYYKHEKKYDLLFKDHSNLLKILEKINSKFILSYYMFDELEYFIKQNNLTIEYNKSSNIFYKNEILIKNF